MPHTRSHFSFVSVEFGGITSTNPVASAELKRVFYSVLCILSADGEASELFVSALNVYGGSQLDVDVHRLTDLSYSCHKYVGVLEQISSYTLANCLTSRVSNNPFPCLVSIQSSALPSPCAFRKFMYYSLSSLSRPVYFLSRHLKRCVIPRDMHYSHYHFGNIRC